MMHDFLQSRLHRVARRQRQLDLWRGLAVCWSFAALVGIGLTFLANRTGWASTLTLPILAALALAGSIALAVRIYTARPDYRALAVRIEERYPELGGVLLTAVQQEIKEPGQIGYLQHRLLQQAVGRAQEQDWRDAVPRSHLLWAHVVHAATLAMLLGVLWWLPEPRPSGGRLFPFFSGEVAVTPGDASLEKGESLVVMARFAGDLPPEVNLIVRGDDGAERTLPLVKSLGDPVFGGSVRDVAADFTYRLEYNGRRTDDYRVTVFEHPRLERANAELTFPAYTALDGKRIEDTRRISAVEGTQLQLDLQLNKPVKTAALVARDEARPRLPLAVEEGRAVATLPPMTLVATQTYDLQLVDADGRANKTATPFVIEVVPNRAPELRIASPRGDVRPSAIEEIGFGGTVWDDFGAPVFGLGYTLAGGETNYVELGRAVPAKERRSFEHLVKLEDLGVEPGQLVSWFLWADDIGPDAQTRRTTTDLYFAEIRPFDEIFRESQNMGGEQPGGGQQGGEQPQRLAELQKQIINATWRLQRNPTAASYGDDAGVVQTSQSRALEQAREAQQEAAGARERLLWSRVLTDMEQAVTQLRLASASPKPLPQALAAEQSAYQTLLQLQPRDTSVTRSGRGGGGGGQQASQRQIDQLDLQQAENRYETQRMAQSPQSPERREDNQVMNRLQELARRQQDFNERLKELQTALQEARTEAEREEIRRQLRRLQEEQQQMLADVDELQQRMRRPENESRLAEQSQRLEQTREDLQRTAEATGEGSVSQALAAGTRAQRELQSLRDELRKESSSQFAEDLRRMRAEARDLARDQEGLSQKFGELGNESRRTLSGSNANESLVEELARQRERLQSLVDQATEVSSQAEQSEPLLSRQLYDSLRKSSQDDARGVKEMQQELLGRGQMTRRLYDRMQQVSESDEAGRTLTLASDMLREDMLPQAREAERRARGSIEELMRGVERAAESVVGDDAESLRLAREELDAVTEQLRREVAESRRGEPGAQAPGESPETGRSGAGSRQAGATPQPGGEPAPSDTPGEQASEGSTGGLAQAGERPGQAPGTEDRPDSAGSPSGEGRAGEREGGRSLAQDADRRGGSLADGGRDARGGGGGGGWGGGFDFGGLFDGDWRNGPLTGEDFARWSDRLRDVEELLDEPELRSEVAAARERARLLRRDFRQDLKKPDWAVVELEIVRPLLEVRNRVAEELARRNSRDSLVPIDRDPVPNRYAEQVRRYYEELGRDH